MSARNEVLNIAPELAAAVAYGAGLVINHAVGQRGDAKEAAVLASAGVTSDELATRRLNPIEPVTDQVQPTPSVLSRRSKIARAFTLREQLLPLTYASAVGMSVLAFSSEPTHKVSSPVIEAVVDHNYYTQGDESIKKINGITKALAGSGHLTVRALIGHKGSYDKGIQISHVDQDQPLGPPSLVETTKAALSDENAGILVITDGNPIGDTNSIIRQAKASGRPVYVANEGVQTDQVAKELRSEAKATGGIYFDNTVSPSSVVNQIDGHLKPHETLQPISTSDKLQEKLFSGLLIGIAAATMKWRAGLQFRRKSVKVNPQA